MSFKENPVARMTSWTLTRSLGHIRESPVSVILEQEVFPILVIAEHVGPPPVQDRSDDHAAAPCRASTGGVTPLSLAHPATAHPNQLTC